MTNKIDFVITWVDGNDPDWQKERNKYLTDKIDTTDNQNADCRYRDMGTLRYWFRGVEKYAPWVNKIYFITWGHLPKWLNTNHEKLKIVKHSDYIPAEYLPTFNSNVIELNLHRIKELNEQFVLFNDDMFLNDYVSEEFFFKNGLPRGSAILNPIFAVSDFSYVFFNNMILINKYFNKQRAIRQNINKFFNLQYGFHNLKNIIFNLFPELCGFKEFHITTPMLKSVLQEIWDKEEKLLNSIFINKFRTKKDINQWLVKYWQFMTGMFEPISPKFAKCYELNDSNNLIKKAIKFNKYKVICINDTNTNYDFERARLEIISAFEEKFPQKSSYES